jgi:hypothetical protein
VRRGASGVIDYSLSHCGVFSPVREIFRGQSIGD